MMQLDVDLTPPLPASNLGSTAARGGKGYTLGPGLNLCSARLSLSG